MLKYGAVRCKIEAKVRQIPRLGKKITFLLFCPIFHGFHLSCWILHMIRNGYLIMIIYYLMMVHIRNRGFSIGVLLCSAAQGCRKIWNWGGGALCVEMGFYTESRCNMNVWVHFCKILLVFEICYWPRVKWMPGKS